MAKRRVLPKKLDIWKSTQRLALPKCSQRATAEQLNISLDEMNEFEKLNGHIRQFLRHEQLMRELTFGEYCFTVTNKENCSFSVTVVHSVNRCSDF